MKFASRPDFITVKKSVMKLNQDGEPMGPAESDDGAKVAPPQMDAPTRVRPFSVGKLRALVEQANEPKVAPARASAVSVSAVITTSKLVGPAASASLLRTPVKMSVVIGIGVLVFAGVVSALALIPKHEAAVSAEPPPAAEAARAPEAVVAPQPPATGTGSGFVFTEPVVLLPGAPAGGTAAQPPVAAKLAEKTPEKTAEKTAEKAPEKTPEKHHAAADKPPAAPPVAKGPEAKPDPKAPPGNAAANEMDEMRRIQQMANSQLDKSIH
jgi:hypothetical protein